MAAPQPSARFVRALVAERAELERHRGRLATEARELRAALARIERGLAEIDERCGLLDRLAPAGDGKPGTGGPRVDGVGHGAAASAGGGAAVPDDSPQRPVLRGPAIRERAVLALIEHGRDSLHYRRWFELLVADGLEIAGKDPLAVFLTQITRSPVVRKGGRAGVYELDRHAPARLTQRLDRLQRELAAAATATADISTIRAQRTRLTAEIGRVERALEEATRVLEPGRRLAAATA